MTATNGGPLLEAEAVSSGYGETEVLRGVSMHVNTGEIVALVGSNGAGKTTMLRTLSGSVGVWDGAVSFEGRSLVGKPPHQVARLGLAHVPEGRKLFAGLSVEANLRLGGYAGAGRSDPDSQLARVYELFPALAEIRHQVSGTLSGGQQQMVAIGRGLMARPSLLMIDELSLGLAPVVVDRIVEALVTIRAEGTATVLLVEQDVQIALSVADRAYVLENGSVVLDGAASELQDRPEVKTAYLGI